MENPRKRCRMESSVCSSHVTSRLRELPPPIVVDYAPYTKRQLTPESFQLRHCAMQWDRYYTHNETRGYKDRHYLLREFVELAAALEKAVQVAREVGVAREGTPTTTNVAIHCVGERNTVAAGAIVELVEIGCGVGNAVVPMLEAYASLGGRFVVYGFDISKVAVAFLRKLREERSALLADRLFAVTHDLSTDDVVFGATDETIPHPVRFGTLIFVLCSVPQERQPGFVRRVAALLACGGTLFVRDYCVGDHAAQRFTHNRRQVGEVLGESENSYLRSNGTLSHFFSVESLTELFVSTGLFTLIHAEAVERSVENRKEDLTLHRKFVQCRFARVPRSITTEQLTGNPSADCEELNTT